MPLQDPSYGFGSSPEDMVTPMAETVKGAREGYGAKRTSLYDTIKSAMTGDNALGPRLTRGAARIRQAAGTGFGGTLLTASPLGQGVGALESLVDTGTMLGEGAAKIANPFGAALAEAPTLDKLFEIGNKRGAKPAPAPVKPAAAADEAAAPAARRVAPNVQLPPTMFADTNAGLGAVANFVAQRGYERADERAAKTAAETQRAVAAALKPQVKFEENPTTGAIENVAVFNPATGQGAKRPVRTVMTPGETAAVMSEADAKFKAGASLDDINAELKKYGKTYTPAK